MLGEVGPAHQQWGSYTIAINGESMSADRAQEFLPLTHLTLLRANLGDMGKTAGVPAFPSVLIGSTNGAATAAVQQWELPQKRQKWRRCQSIQSWPR